MNSSHSIFNMAGVVPPIAPGHDGTSTQRSPYSCSISEFIEVFAISPERINILDGFLNYRSELYNIGITTGFQWLNGSFVTDIETLESRPPGDIDVVTFYDIPAGETQASLFSKNANLFFPKESKEQYHVDAYAMTLSQPMSPAAIKNITYWYSMWSHRKSDNMWKGFFQIPLSPNDDLNAFDLLANINAGGQV